MTRRVRVWPATPTLRGRDAEAVLRELAHGTPDTPERVRMIHEADTVYRRATLDDPTEATDDT